MEKKVFKIPVTKSNPKLDIQNGNVHLLNKEMRNRVLSNFRKSIFTAPSTTDGGASLDTQESPTNGDTPEQFPGYEIPEQDHNPQNFPYIKNPFSESQYTTARVM
mmetsp:Transcript_11284/g.9682  ORF Transcript_11284/g.9682 Transcript_11284/m.9682 type:complete len:105 (-) Transcript_11284:955-1269(-)